MPAKTVVFIHGASVTPLAWEYFKGPFEAAGYAVQAPTWPEMERPIDEFRANPGSEFARLTIGDIVDHLERVIRPLREPPLIVGHSFGGLFAQQLLERGVGSAAVAIDPAPSAFTFPDFTTLSAITPPLLHGPFGIHYMSRPAFSVGFANFGTEAERQALYKRHVVPTNCRIFWQAAMHMGNGVHPDKRTQPLLFTAGDIDKTITPFVVKQGFNMQRKSKAPTEYKEFPGRTHFLIAQPGWEEVADYILQWHAKT